MFIAEHRRATEVMVTGLSPRSKRTQDAQGTDAVAFQGHAAMGQRHSVGPEKRKDHLKWYVCPNHCSFLQDLIGSL